MLLHPCSIGEPPRKRNLKHPETEEVNDRRRNRIAGPIEGLQHHHGVGVADISAAQDAKRRRCNGHDSWIVNEETYRWRGKEDKEDADTSQKNHVVKTSAPH